jgi:hypothetical protein
MLCWPEGWRTRQAGITEKELNMLLGISTQIEKKIEKR